MRARIGLAAFLVIDLLVAANQQAWSRMLDNPQGGHGDLEALFALLLSVLAGAVVAVAALRRRKPKMLGAAFAAPIAVFLLSWCLGLAATHLFQPHYCADIVSPGQCLRCFEGDEQRRRCGG
jgi:hypothetical protein